MEKSLFEQIGGAYHQEGDYLIPNFAPPKTAPIGICIFGSITTPYTQLCFSVTD